MLSATAVALEFGYDLDSIAKGLSKCIGAPGRFERVPHYGDFAVVVDYAHSDDALLNTLKTARDLTNGRIITVFGCGGDRDKTKRAPMGEVAGRNSDLVIITSDNPRTENPLQIIGGNRNGFETYKLPVSNNLRPPRSDLSGNLKSQTERCRHHCRKRSRNLSNNRHTKNIISTTAKSRSKHWQIWKNNLTISSAHKEISPVHKEISSAHKEIPRAYREILPAY